MNQNRIARFQKISFEQYIGDVASARTVNLSSADDINNIKKEYDEIIIPARSTIRSAGYDFYSPFEFTLLPNDTILIPTGIRCQMDESWVLNIYPRSSLGFKYQLGLANNTAIIDSDYYFANNEGHIMIKLVNKGDKTVSIKQNDRFVQGVFLPYGITFDDEVETLRTGGIGSTNV